MYQDLAGHVGVLVQATRGAAGPGEILLRVNGTREAFFAHSDSAIAAGSAVLVVHTRPHRSVDVVPWVAAPTPEGVTSETEPDRP